MKREISNGVIALILIGYLGLDIFFKIYVRYISLLYAEL